VDETTDFFLLTSPRSVIASHCLADVEGSLITDGIVISDLLVLQYLTWILTSVSVEFKVGIGDHRYM